MERWNAPPARNTPVDTTRTDAAPGHREPPAAPDEPAAPDVASPGRRPTRVLSRGRGNRPVPSARTQAETSTRRRRSVARCPRPQGSKGHGPCVSPPRLPPPPSELPLPSPAASPTRPIPSRSAESAPRRRTWARPLPRSAAATARRAPGRTLARPGARPTRSRGRRATSCRATPRSGIVIRYSASCNAAWARTVVTSGSSYLRAEITRSSPYATSQAESTSPIDALRSPMLAVTPGSRFTAVGKIGSNPGIFQFSGTVRTNF
ncbi:DUF2690 domain-containing protein [Sorangium sp. So ce363]|uniref:DUF2690 domain-containing protein n=1 Tax=Sorangium sp. So ce363 TaxID=3133304 RepID=UPI003F60EAC1